MEVILQALTYPQIGKIIYTCANLDTQKAISDFRSLISQGVNVIVGYADAGNALAAAVQDATKRGIPFSTYVGGIIGTPGKDYLNVIQQDLCGLGKQFAAIINKNVGGRQASPSSAARRATRSPRSGRTARRRHWPRTSSTRAAPTRAGRAKARSRRHRRSSARPPT